MALVVGKTTTGREYKVKDISKADMGRRIIQLHETFCRSPHMDLRAKLSPTRPFKGVRITVMLERSHENSLLIETLASLGAEVRWCCRPDISTADIDSTDEVAAAIARDSAAVFACSRDTLQEYWWCTERALDFGSGIGPDIIIDYHANAALLILMGVKAEKEFKKSGKVPDPTSTDDPEYQIMLTMIRDGLKDDPKKYSRMPKRLVGVSEETPTGLRRLYQMQANRTLRFPAIDISNFNDCKLDDLCTYHGSRVNLMNQLSHFNSKKERANMLEGVREIQGFCAGKVAVVHSYRLLRDYAAALKQLGAKVIVIETDPVQCRHAVMDGFSVLPQGSVLPSADIYVATGSNRNIFTVDYMRKMKNYASVWKIGHSGDKIDMLGLEAYPGVKRIPIVPGFSYKLVFPDTHNEIFVLAEYGLRNLGYSSVTVCEPSSSLVMSDGLPDPEGHPMHFNEMLRHYEMMIRLSTFVTVCSHTDHISAVLELLKERNSGKYKNEVYVLPKCVDVKVESLRPRKPRFRDKAVGALPALGEKILCGVLMCFCREENGCCC